MTAYFRRSLLVAAAAVCLLAPSLRINAQQYRFQYFGVDEGLTNLLVQSIYQDRGGFLWISTQGGIFRYDGDRFRKFGRGLGLPLMAGAAIAEASDGTLLVGGADGLFRLSGDRFVRVPLPGNPEVSRLHGIQSDTHGETYVSTTLGLMVLSGSSAGFTVRTIPQQPLVSSREAWGVSLDGNAVWYGCGRQLCELAGERVSVFGPSAGLPSAIWVPIGRDLDGRFWVQGRGADIRFLPRGAPEFQKAAGPLPAWGFTGLPAIDGSGSIIFPSPDGLVIRRSKSWWTVNRSSGLNGTAYSAYRDRQGSLWIGLEGQGLVRWAGYRQWEAYTPASGFDSDVAYQILTPPDGSVWVATVAGLFHGIRRAESYEWHRVAALGRTPLVSLAFDGAGKLWFGTEQAGLGRLDPATGAVQWVRKAGLDALSISALLIDRQHRMWAATEGGLYTAESPYRRFLRVEKLPPSRFWSIVEAKSGDIWAGGDSGLYRLTGSSWTRFTTSDGLSHNEVIALGAAPDGAIWAGYRTGGEIDRIRTGTGSVQIGHDSRLGSLGASIVYFFGFDPRGRMWAGTNRGVGVLENGRWIRMDRNDGLVWDDCDGNGFAVAPDGSVWIGTSNGLAHFQPPPQFDRAKPSPIVFTRLALGGKDVEAPAQHPSVDYRSNSFVVQYSSLDFVHGSTASYRYRLLPLFTSWRTTDRRELEFPGLPPGNYRFQVAAHAPRGQADVPAAEFAFQVSTPWFRSWWFGALALFLAFCLFVLVIKMRIAALKRHEAELMWLVEERTADLKQANEELYRLSSIDDLTGIANRRVCDDLLRREWARMNRSGEPLSAMMLDVDHFKMLNDAEGHQRGDQYLVRLAEMLRSLVKRETDLAARYGGEEFIIVLPATGAREAEQFAELLRASIETLCLTHRSSPVAPVLTISVGVGTALPNSFNSVAGFMDAIDRALYAAKARGRNRVITFAQLLHERGWSEPVPETSRASESDH